MRLRIVVVLWISLSFLLISTYQTLAAGVVGSGTPASCTEASFDLVLAQVMVSGGTIAFDCGTASYTLIVTSPKLITREITIDGGGLITLSGGGSTTILELNDRLPMLTLKNLTLADGYATAPTAPGVCLGDACGGAVRGHFLANLTIINCRFVNNRAVATALTSQDNGSYGGGAIYLHTGILTVSNSEFIGNQVENGAGGAIHLLHSNAIITDTLFDNNESNYYAGAFASDGTINDGKGITSDGILQFTRTTFRNNRGRGQGGAVFSYLYLNRHPNVVAIFEDSQFINNTVSDDSLKSEALGGALRLGNGPVHITNTTFSGNSAQGQGGAIWMGELGNVLVVNSTFYGNQAGVMPNDGYGGAIKTAGSGLFSLTNSTIVNNHASGQGGGIWSKGLNVSLVNTIIANNTAANSIGAAQNCDRTYSGSNDLQSPRLNANDPPCAPGVKFGDPKLGPLADNSGFGQTMALLTFSPAIDAGRSAGCPETDARGRFRTFDGNGDGIGQCDIGAYEYTEVNHPSAVKAPPYRNNFNIATPTLTWNKLDWATAYQIQVDNNLDFSSVNYVYESPDPGNLSITIGPLQGGVYYWRVRAKRPDGAWGTWSNPDNFLVRVP